MDPNGNSPWLRKDGFTCHMSLPQEILLRQTMLDWVGMGCLLRGQIKGAMLFAGKDAAADDE